MNWVVVLLPLLQECYLFIIILGLTDVEDYQPYGDIFIEKGIRNSDSFTSFASSITRWSGSEQELEFLEDSTREFRKSGKILFSTSYNDRLKTLEIHVVKASNFTTKSKITYTFVRIYLQPGKKQQQRTKDKKTTSEVVVNEKFSFKVNKNEFIKHKLKIKVYRHERMKKNNLLGEVCIALSSIDVTKADEFDIDMFIRS